jgi:hypothetical protein
MRSRKTWRMAFIQLITSRSRTHLCGKRQKLPALHGCPSRPFGRGHSLPVKRIPFSSIHGMESVQMAIPGYRTAISKRAASCGSVSSRRKSIVTESAGFWVRAFTKSPFVSKSLLVLTSRRISLASFRKYHLDRIFDARLW